MEDTSKAPSQQQQEEQRFDSFWTAWKGSAMGFLHNHEEYHEGYSKEQVRSDAYERVRKAITYQKNKKKKTNKIKKKGKKKNKRTRKKKMLRTTEWIKKLRLKQKLEARRDRDDVSKDDAKKNSNEDADQVPKHAKTTRKRQAPADDETYNFVVVNIIITTLITMCILLAPASNRWSPTSLSKTPLPSLCSPSSTYHHHHLYAHNHFPPSSQPYQG
jgi:hypothetical protein